MKESLKLSLLKYYSDVIAGCKDCSSVDEYSSAFTFKKLLPFNGETQKKVLILGHSPIVRTRSSITVTLDLDKKESNLSRYIKAEVLYPLGIEINECAATNLVKCVTTEMPENLFINGTAFMDVAYGICKQHFIKEVDILKPKLIISLSERVSTLLQKDFNLDEKIEKLQFIFATLRQLRIGSFTYHWIPVVHIPKPKVRAHYFPMQTNRLIELRKEILSII